MKASYSKNFLKQYKKLLPKISQKVDERIILWQKDPYSSRLRNHPLGGKYKGYRSIDIAGDIRAPYFVSQDIAIFDAVDIHSQLYG